MKYKILSAVIAASLLSACGGSSSGGTDTPDPTPNPGVTEYSVKAFDPAVANMDVSFACTDGTTGTAGVTDADGLATITAGTPLTAPETCTYTFAGRSNAVDMSNGKSMANVVFEVPQGMAQAGQLVTGSPLSTLLAKTLGDTPYSESAATRLLTDLGLDSLVNSGLTVAQIMLDPETAAASTELSAEQKATLLATTAVVSDTIIANPTATPAQLTESSKAVAAAVLVDYPEYPADSTGAKIYLNVQQASQTVVADPTATVTVPAPTPAVEQTEAPTGGDAAVIPGADDEPVDDEPATGGTGGTSGSADDSTGA